MTVVIVQTIQKPNISIHMPHTWHDVMQDNYTLQTEISIHMPHTWHDHQPDEAHRRVLISIHMPHTWHDYAAWADAVRKIFQSTCHIRGMTHDEKHPDDVATISIHMPHTWHDHTSFRPRHSLIFQSTCHIRGMTIRTTPASPAKGFQSTCHIRGMTMVWTMTTAGSAFQSTCHIRGMTLALQGDLHLFVHISIHMPHTWHDVLAHDVAESVGNFNPHATYVA